MKTWRLTGIVAGTLAAFAVTAAAQTPKQTEEAARKAREQAREIQNAVEQAKVPELLALTSTMKLDASMKADLELLTAKDLALKVDVDDLKTRAMTLADEMRWQADTAIGVGRGIGSGLGFGGDQGDREREREERLYQRGQSAIDSRQWDRAIEAFAEVAAMKGSKADGAWYWAAWAQNRQGNRSEALSSIEKLRQGYPKSQWIDDAKTLELEIKQRAGQPIQPDTQDDEDLKLMALNALMNIEPERAVATLEKLLQGTESPKLKQRALFVLAQSNTPEARKVIGDVARGTRNPDLQERAVQYLGAQGGQASRQLLQEIYRGSQNVDVKRRIIRAFMTSGDRERLVAVAREESNAELRREAIRQLGAMNAQDDLWQLYQNESDLENRKSIIRAMYAGGAAERLIQIAQQEKDRELRKTAIQGLGTMGSRRTGEALVAIYAADKDPEIRKVVINGLFVQNNAKALVDIARKETDVEMKKQIVGKLSNMKAKEATDYLLEILNKGD